MRSLLAGVGLIGVGVIISWLKQDEQFLLLYATFVGGGLWLVSAILSGALVSGDRIRANYATETAEDRANRHLWMIRFFLAGIPSAIVAIILIIQQHS